MFTFWSHSTVCLLFDLTELFLVGRDIDLNLEDINGLYEGQELPVELEGENLILTKPLDKEGIAGADSILVDVVCQRQRSSDPSFTIPVHVRVTDVNDNPPVFTGAPFNLSLSELTVVGSKILTVTTSGKSIYSRKKLKCKQRKKVCKQTAAGFFF